MRRIKMLFLLLLLMGVGLSYAMQLGEESVLSGPVVSVTESGGQEFEVVLPAEQKYGRSINAHVTGVPEEIARRLIPNSRVTIRAVRTGPKEYRFMALEEAALAPAREPGLGGGQ